MRSISYEVIQRPRYKYILTRAYVHTLHHHYEGTARLGEWATLQGQELYIARRYAWDGASGPALDTVSVHRASLVHDTLYQLIAAGLLRKNPWKRYADQEFRRICKEDGVGWFRRNYAYAAVRLFGAARDEYRPDGLH